MTTSLDTPILDGAIRNVNFFNGRLLTARDLWRVQLAAEDGDRRLGHALGDGVAFGLEVSAPAPTDPSPWLRVERGLCLNRAGEALCLEATTDVALLESADDTPVGSGFAPCMPLAGGTYVAGAGVFLLTLCSAQAREGRAPTSGLDETAGKCNTDTIVRAVQFRLLRLDPHLARDCFEDLGNPAQARARNDHEIRNRVAHACFGTAALAAYDAAPLAADARSYGLLDALRETGALSPCDVPLAVFYRTLSGGIRFVDDWAVRRRVAAPSPAGLRAAHTGERREAEAEATMLQFEAQAEALRREQDLAAPGVQVEQFFGHLPPVACLRFGGTRGFDLATFLGAHAPVGNRTTPLSAGLARAVVLRGLQEAAVAVVSRTATNASPVRYRAYRVDGATDYVLLARSALAETVARDVHFDDTVCALTQVDNVQDAIDQLCSRLSGTCTLTLSPAMDCHARIATLAPGASAEICFQAGDYALPRPLEIRGLKHVKLHGAGFGTRLARASGEVALLVRDCESVVVRDLHAEGGTAASGARGAGGLGGALTFLDCGSVRVDNVSARCAGAAKRAAACIVVRNARSVIGGRPTEALVLDARCTVGHAQTGILVVNAARAELARNHVALAEDATLAPFAGDPEHLVRFRRQLLSVYARNTPGGIAPPTAEREHTARGYELTYRHLVLHYRAASEFGQVLSRIVAELAPNVGTEAQLAAVLKDFAAQAARRRGASDLKDPGLRRAVLTAFQRLERLARPAAQQGIVVGGGAAGDVRIRDNVLVGVEQGVHVGVSERGGALRQAGRVQITGNSIDLVASALTTGERHAIFAGSCDSLVVEGNHAALAQTGTLTAVASEPLRLWGRYGRRLLVRGNHFAGFGRGIYLRFVKPGDGAMPWVVQHNWVPGVRHPVEIVPTSVQFTVDGPNFN